MRLKNKISIKGDTLTIFKEGMFNSMKGGANLSTIAKKIYDELQLMGSYDSSDRQLLIKQAGLSGNDAKTVSDMLFVMDADERYDDMSRYNEAIKQYLEEGEDEIDFDDENFSDSMIDGEDDRDDDYDDSMDVYSDEYEMLENMNEAKMYYHVLEDGGYGRIGHQGYYNTPEEAKKRADELSDMFPKLDFYVEAYLSKREPVTVTMESNAVNEAKKAKTNPKDKKKADKTNYGQKDIADIDMVNPYELKKGIRIEMVDTEDYVKAMDKAVKKLKKDPMFYSNLIANSKHVKADKRSDLPKEVKDKKLNKTSDKMKDKANEMEVSKKDATKKNANDTLNKKEMAKGKPKGVKEMDTPGKETKAKLKESISIFNSLKKLLLS